MAHRQLVMLNCKMSHKTPAVRVKPDFTHISVAGIGQKDRVWLHLERRQATAKISIELQSGLNPFPHNYEGHQFQIEKLAGSNTEPTTIEIIRGS